MTNNSIDQYAHQLRLSNVLREPALRSAIQALQLPPGTHGLDAGCGIGLHTVSLLSLLAQPDTSLGLT